MHLIRQAMERARQLQEAGASSDVIGHRSADTAAARGEAFGYGAPLPDVASLATPVQLPFDTAQARQSRIVLAEDESPAAHSLRMLRAQLQRPLESGAFRTIGIVAPRRGAGTSLVALNLALCFAADTAYAVTLLELDLRAPRLRSLLQVASKHGIDDYLAGRVSLEEAAFALCGIDRLQILAVREPGSLSASGFAGTQRLQALFQGARQALPGQLMLVDLPPALASDDVLSLARGLDGVIMVGYEGRTRRDELGNTLRLLKDVPVLGAVLNGASGIAGRVV